MTDLRRWLDSLGLGEYAEAFEDHAVDFRSLPVLTEDDLKELGLKLGHRRILQQAIAALADVSGAVPPVDMESHARPLPGGAHRRQLTVMFCDLVDSTALCARMDPERYRDVLAAYQSTAKLALDRYEGYIARYVGDGLLVYFGYPQAHEDDPERALRAGLDVVEAVDALELELDVALQVRIGIAAGQVVMICGEPGIGKSRVIQELRRRIGPDAFTVLQYQCSSYHTGSSFYPFVVQLQRAAGFDQEDSADTRERKIHALVEQVLHEDETALDYSKKHGTRSFELRTLMSLAKLLDDPGKRQEARDRLSTVLDSFTEGFETADLRQARELVAVLS